MIFVYLLGNLALVAAQTSPVWLADVAVPTANVVRRVPRIADVKAGPIDWHFPLDRNTYPSPLKQPPSDHPEVQAVMKQLDWARVPPIEPRKVTNWTLDIKNYDTKRDPDCWWSSTTCRQPKLAYLPADIYMCPDVGVWGLNYDDGPFKIRVADHKDKPYEQPRFYNYLVEKAKQQKATLFFVGSNVISFPEAAQRALNDGHTICSHTWSHPQMTTLSNEEVVAQFYWTQKAIKQVLGITPKCWRPPYGDVDDRIRAVAWQMGMRTFLWDQDSNDWNMPGTAGLGKITPDVVDSYFQKWVVARQKDQDKEHGHITLQHENSNSTVAMSEKWLPILQKNFKVMPIHQCLNDPQPYWEQQWVYPTLDHPVVEDNDSNKAPEVTSKGIRRVIPELILVVPIILPLIV
ncbi:hypothetical protein DFQ28_010566 [Apophysomyces sp. BC1034]|nr:hypothetical protein DFQ30_001554 [Apophysomyces sp. BC1015]KAG0183516.1 hypothetical protein DFQ29_002570 [Apophysomyces sp. BC1021]KAG0194482.1 hypothetical protein DFQ28_010566 [Apophysomyces sp. BC1034]